MHIYLIKRGPKPEYHNAPFHPVIICAKRKVAKWEAGSTSDRAWLWERASHIMDGAGFLLMRWNGLDIDYGHVVHNVGDMPDGAHSGFYHPGRGGEPWTLLKGAIWWDDKPLPPSLVEMGVIYPPDDFTQQRILDTIADDGCSGFPRAKPAYWLNTVDVGRAGNGATPAAQPPSNP